jgi:hypothetical protein
LPVPILEQDAIGEVLALLQFVQFLTEKAALLLDRPKPVVGSVSDALAAGEAPLDVARQRQPDAAKDQGRGARENQLDDVDRIHHDFRSDEADSVLPEGWCRREVTATTSLNDTSREPDERKADWQEWSRQAVAEMQARTRAWIERFTQERAPYRWDRDMAEPIFPGAGDCVMADISVIGTASPAQRIFRWAWADETIAPPRPARLGPGARASDVSRVDLSRDWWTRSKPSGRRAR